MSLAVRFTLLVTLLGLSLTVAPAGAAAAAIEAQIATPRIHSATLEADIDPQGEPTHCVVQYVAAAEFQISQYTNAKTVPCEPEDLDAGAGTVTVTAHIDGLEIDHVYHFRFLAGTDVGADETFATFGFDEFNFEVLDKNGFPETRAGAHPYQLIAFMKVHTPIVRGLYTPTGVLKDLLTELPPGLVGSAAAVPPCPSRLAEEQRCSGDSQVGRIWVRYAQDVAATSAPLYRIVAPRGKAASFAGSVNLSRAAFVDASVRTGDDYGITAGGFNVTSFAQPWAVMVEMWGVPADGGHDADRSCPDPAGGYGLGCASNAPEKPFLTMPSECAGPLTVTSFADAYNSPGEWVDATAELPPVTNCNALEFAPQIEARPTNNVADSPTGLHVDLHVPQNEDPDGVAAPDLRHAAVKLPPGLTLNPSSAAGLEACSPDQFGLTTPVGTTPIHTTPGPARCPAAAKIGTVEVDTPLLEHALPGAVYVATPYENPFGSLLAIYIAVDDPESGVVVKLAGRVEIGPDGQLTTTFEENPQLPFEDFKLDFFGGPRAALKTPAVCGTFHTESTLTPWSAPESGPPATPSDTYQVAAAPAAVSCPTASEQMPNAPRFEAATESPLAGSFSPFVLRLSREDGSQRFGSLTVTPPPGLLGRLAGIPYCSDAGLATAANKSGKEEQATPSCPEASRVGSVNVGAGAGPSPYYTQGRAYLAGPYRGAPLSLAIVTPAVAGPYDLGTVVVRSALAIDPYTAQITVKSDPIPSELKGIQLDVRSIVVRMDRSQFTLNPTNCEAMAVGGSLTSTLGQTVPLANRFQVGECGALGFKPKLAFSLEGSTRRTGHPALTAWLRMPAGGANIARAQVSLPRGEFLDQGNLGNVCTQPELAAASCPKRSIYGYAKAWSPLLDRPLEGPVYLGTGYGHVLPDLVAELNGQIRVLLHGKVDSARKGGIRNTFEVVPDAPVSRFMLRLKGGKHYGLIQNSVSLCAKTQRLAARFVGQNGQVAVLHPKIRTTCANGKHKRGTRR